MSIEKYDARNVSVKRKLVYSIVCLILGPIGLILMFYIWFNRQHTTGKLTHIRED